MTSKAEWPTNSGLGAFCATKMVEKMSMYWHCWVLVTTGTGQGGRRDELQKGALNVSAY
jgi:hypothetical protein